MILVLINHQEWCKMPQSFYAIFYFMEHWKNLSLENIVEEFDSVVYTEEWKDVNGYSKYKISNFGRVKSYAGRCSNKPLILKARPNRDGYIRVDFFGGNRKKNFSLHRLVGLHFIPNPENKPEVCHKDDIRYHNYFYNLEWGTHKENMEGAVARKG